MIDLFEISDFHMAKQLQFNGPLAKLGLVGRFPSLAGQVLYSLSLTKPS